MSRAGQQLPLDLGVPPRTARHRPVQVQPEEPGVYRAVEVLRAAGLRVYRNGALHLVDGKLLTTAELMRLFHAQQRREQGKADR